MRLGWLISVHRQKDGGAAPALFQAGEGDRLANWQTEFHEIQWILDLVEQKKAIHLGDSGWESKYTAEARQILPVIKVKFPEPEEAWCFDTEDSLHPDWAFKTAVSPKTMDSCRLGEWLLIRAVKVDNAVAAGSSTWKTWSIIGLVTLLGLWMVSETWKQSILAFLCIAGSIVAVLGVLCSVMHFHRERCPRCRRRGLKLIAAYYDGPSLFLCHRCGRRLVQSRDGAEWRDATTDESTGL